MLPQEYRFTLDALSYSEIRCFNECPRLYFEQYIAKTYKQEDKDYFLYGQVVDALLTQPWTLPEKFVRVTRRTEGGFIEEVKEMQVIEAKIAELEPQAPANKTKAKSLEKAKRELEELRARVSEIKSVGERTQVTGAIWDNAHETAEVMKRNPLFASHIKPLLDTDTRFPFQQMVYDLETMSKGTLDVLVLSPEVQEVLNAFRGGKITKQDACEEVKKLGQDHHDGYIIDIKTTAALKKLDPTMYAAQLAYYQYIVEQLTGLKLPCFILVGDKDASDKVAQDYSYSQELLDLKLQKMLGVRELMAKSIQLYKETQDEKWFPAAKSIYGRRQECFKCSHCKERPYSFNAPAHVTVKDLMQYGRT